MTYYIYTTIYIYTYTLHRAGIKDTVGSKIRKYKIDQQNNLNRGK